MELEAAGFSDRGRVREENEDAMLVDLERGLFVVADGCGGHAAGEVASRHVVTTLSQRAADLRKDSPLDQLGDAIRAAGATIYDHSQMEPQLAGMATTATALLLDGDHGYIAHIGDTRLYCLRQDRLRQLTEDHTLAAEMLRRGLMQPLDIKTWAYRNTLQRALGHNQRGQVDTAMIEVQASDVLLLCSDGLHGLLEDDEIHRCLTQAESLSPVLIAQKLVELANEKGGTDNISAVVVKVLPARPGKRTADSTTDPPAGPTCKDADEGDLLRALTSGEPGRDLTCDELMKVLGLLEEQSAVLLRDDPALGMRLLLRLSQQLAARLREAQG